MEIKNYDIFSVAELAKELITNSIEGIKGIDIEEIKTQRGKKIALVLRFEDDINVAPVVYLEKFLNKLNNGENLMDYVNDIKEEVERRRKFKDNFVIQNIMDYEAIKDKIFYRIENSFELRDDSRIYIHYEKYTVVPYVYVCDECRIPINYQMLSTWNVSQLDIVNIGKENIVKLADIEFTSMTKLLISMMETELPFPEIEVPQDDTMFVLLDNRNIVGAALITIEEVREMIANQLNSDYYIIPSSVHEVIIVPTDKAINGNTDYIKDIIKEVNTNVVSETDKLSDDLWYYNRATKRFDIVE